MGPNYAGILGSLAFVLTLTRGLIDGSSTESMLWLAIGCLLVFATVGYISGRVADRVLWDALKRQFEDEMHAREPRTTTAEPHRS